MPDAAFLQGAEERREAVKVALRERVVFVVVTFGTRERRAEKSLADRGEREGRSLAAPLHCAGRTLERELAKTQLPCGCEIPALRCRSAKYSESRTRWIRFVQPVRFQYNNRANCDTNPKSQEVNDAQ